MPDRQIRRGSLSVFQTKLDLDLLVLMPVNLIVQYINESEFCWHKLLWWSLFHYLAQSPDSVYPCFPWLPCISNMMFPYRVSASVRCSRSVMIPLLSRLSVHQSIRPVCLWVCVPMCWCTCVLIGRLHYLLWNSGARPWRLGRSTYGTSGCCVSNLFTRARGRQHGKNRIFKPHSQWANTQSEQCAVEVIKANGFSRT